MRDSEQSTLVAELIREFLEFYRLEYTLAIFNPETNLKGKTQDKEALAKKAGINFLQEKPILLQLLEAMQSGSLTSEKIPKEKEVKKIEPLSVKSLPKA